MTPIKTARTFHLKELLTLGLTKANITNVVQKAEAFRDVPKQQGYAIEYTFNQAVLLHVGGELSRLGMSFRHVDKILFDLSTVDFEKHRERIDRGRIVMFIFGRALPEEAHARLGSVRVTMEGKGLATGKAAPRRTPARMASIGFWLLRERDAQSMNDVLESYIRLSLHKMVLNVAAL